MFCFTIKDNYEQAYRMVVILEELSQFGPIGYFFSPYEFPLLAYSVLHLHYNSGEQIQIQPELVTDIIRTLKQIDKNILN